MAAFEVAAGNWQLVNSSGTSGFNAGVAASDDD